MSSRLSILRSYLKEDMSWNSVFERLALLDSEDFRCIINEQSEKYICGYYVAFSMQHQTSYNLVENKFETVEIKKQNIVKFDISVETKRILLWGNKKAADIFLTSLSQAADNKIVLDNFEINIKKVIKTMQTIPNVHFSKTRISNVIIDEGIVANCSVNLSILENPYNILNKYIDYVTQITAVVGEEHNQVSITLYPSGSIVVSKERDSIDDDVINTLVEIVGGGF